uniref:Zgc:152948 n=1 Tax=Scleropages formosus TaxID=113540 RepID=A0A8C9SBM2_SCLFO
MASSPESTVTLLLASSGRLKSSLFNDSTKTIRYKDREYESATEALDAYIEDFQRSLGTTESTMGEIYLRKDAILKEKLTDLELDYLNLPVGSPKRQSDCLSLTTDDLLVLPSDGSLPITHTSAFLTESENYPLGHRSYSRSYNSSSCLQQQSQNLLVSKETVERRSHCKDQDRKDFYPLRDRAKKRLNLQTSFMSPLHSVPSWLAELEASYSELWKNSQWSQSGDKQKNLRTYCEEADHQTLRNLRRDFAEQVATAEENSTTYNKPFCDDKIESLILKAEKVLKSPSLGLSSLTSKSVSSPHTEDVLDADRPWDNPPVTFKAPVPIGGAEDHLNVKTPAVHSCSSGYSSRKHPGPVEALKQMLFSLQGVEQQKSEKIIDDYEIAPSGQSLQRALHHLGRLKCLVDDMNNKKVFISSFCLQLSFHANEQS